MIKRRIINTSNVSWAAIYNGEEVYDYIYEDAKQTIYGLKESGWYGRDSEIRMSIEEIIDIGGGKWIVSENRLITLPHIKIHMIDGEDIFLYFESISKAERYFSARVESESKWIKVNEFDEF